MRLVADGLTNREIAEKLGLTSAGTIHNYRMNVYRKLGLNSGAALARWAVENGLVRRRAGRKKSAA